jgi:hypothetical protein
MSCRLLQQQHVLVQIALPVRQRAGSPRSGRALLRHLSLEPALGDEANKRGRHADARAEASEEDCRAPTARVDAICAAGRREARAGRGIEQGRGERARCEVAGAARSHEHAEEQNLLRGVALSDRREGAPEGAVRPAQAHPSRRVSRGNPDGLRERRMETNGETKPKPMAKAIRVA